MAGEENTVTVSSLRKTYAGKWARFEDRNGFLKFWGDTPYFDPIDLGEMVELKPGDYVGLPRLGESGYFDHKIVPDR